MRALVVDDSRTIRAAIGRMLKELNFEVLEGRNGREALDKLKEIGTADLAMVDWNMPEMNGLEFVRAVRSDANYNSMPMVMVTTNTEMEHIALALEAGANEYIMKPFTKEMIVEKLSIVGISLS